MDRAQVVDHVAPLEAVERIAMQEHRDRTGAALDIRYTAERSRRELPGFVELLRVHAVFPPKSAARSLLNRACSQLGIDDIPRQVLEAESIRTLIAGRP